jgi:hypothetical protein
MQWTDGVNGGFSDAPKRKLVRRVVEGGYGPELVNASDQRHDDSSLLHFMRTLIARYRASAEMGWGQFELIPQPEPQVMVHTLAGAEGRMVALHNFGDAGVTAEITVPDATGEHHLVDLLVDGRTVALDEGGHASIPMDGYGYRWYRLIGPDSPEEMGAFYSEVALRLVQHHPAPRRSRSPGAESGSAPRRPRSKAGSAG